jgi:hypothetical protein
MPRYSLKSSGRKELVHCECRGFTEEAQARIKSLGRELEDARLQEIRGTVGLWCIRFPLTEHNKQMLVTLHAQGIKYLNFYFFGPDSWVEITSSHMMVTSVFLWLDFDHKLCDEFLEGTYSDQPKLISLPYSAGHSRKPAKSLSYCYYLPYQIVYVPGLEPWIESAASSFCAVPFPQSRRDRKAIYDAYPDSDERCRELTSWRMDEAVWQLTDYALIVPRHTISLAHSATITGRVPEEKNEGKAPFHLRDLMGVPTVLKSSVSDGIAYISEEVNTFSENSQICDRRTIYPKDLVVSLFASLDSRQKGKLGVYPVEVL